MGEQFVSMHIRQAEANQPESGRQNDSGIGRKLRLGGVASRVPAQSQKKTAETPLRALVNAIGQSMGSRTPRGQPAGSKTPSTVKSSLFSTGKSSSTPADGTRSKSLFSSEGRKSVTSSAAAKSSFAGGTPRIPSTPKSSKSQVAAATPSKIPATPSSWRKPITAPTPSRRSSLSSSSSSNSSGNSASSNPVTKQSISSSTPSSRLVPATPSRASRRLDPITPVTKKSSIPPRTPVPQHNPTTPSTKPSCIPGPISRRLAVNSTPAKQPSTQTRSKSFFPTTPVSKHTSGNPSTPVDGLSGNPSTPVHGLSRNLSTPAHGLSRNLSTPVHGLSRNPSTRGISGDPSTPVQGLSRNPSTPVHAENGFNTPHTEHGSNQTFYTPTSTLPLTPLQPRHSNLPESSRKLLFGISVAGNAEQENIDITTPRPASAVITEATFSFDKNRLAQIKARKNTSQLLKSPAQRVRASDLHRSSTQTPRALQQVAEDRSTCFEEGILLNSLSHSPTRRKVANSLF